MGDELAEDELGHQVLWRCKHVLVGRSAFGGVCHLPKASTPPQDDPVVGGRVGWQGRPRLSLAIFVSTRTICASAALRIKSYSMGGSSCSLMKASGVVDSFRRRRHRVPFLQGRRASYDALASA